MFWAAVGMVAAIAGAIISFYTLWSNYDGNEKTRILLIGEMSVTGVIYTPLIFFMYTLLFPEFTDYATLLLGLSALGINMGKAVVGPTLARLLSKERLCYGRIVVFNSLFETFLLYVLLISVLIYSIHSDSGIAVNAAAMAITLVSLFSTASGVALGYVLKTLINSDSAPEKMCRERFAKIIVRSIPTQFPAVFGVLLAMLELMPYMK